jgi:hypothetical protein
MSATWATRGHAHKADRVAFAAGLNDEALEALWNPVVAFGSDGHVSLLMSVSRNVGGTGGPRSSRDNTGLLLSINR